MKTIKAARIHNYGGWKAVKVEEVLLPKLRTGELLIRVYAAGVNPIDWKIRTGYLQQMMPLSLPFTLGGDFSGVVEEIRPGIANFKVGDEVYGQAPVFSGASGSFAEAVIIRTTGSIALKPRSVDHAEASALPLAGVSALEALTVHLRVSAGQKILIHGGAGGIGSMAIQIAKHLGAHVATTVSPNNIEYVRSLGAHTVIDYKKQDFEDVVSGLDAVFDTVGGDTYVRSYKVLKKGGRLVSMLRQPLRDLMKEFAVVALAQFTQVTTERLNTLARLVDQRVLKVYIDETFSPERAGEALLHVEKGSPRGKVVLRIAESDQASSVAEPTGVEGDAR
ncbi:MAG TPA: NADP-dependent oxidoreductase [Steroidobacteraceae bacterium]|jgi:NADPH:quinone reductase-like Zn-dependent oxidoreductase